MKKIISVLLVMTGAMSTASAMDKLSGTPIASGPSMDYTTGEPSETVNTAANLFDANLDTYFASYAPSYSWGGLDLGSPYMIERIGWAPRSDISEGGASVCLAVIQGANSPDWLDAVPLFLITEDTEVGKITYADINCSKGFRYIRYVTLPASIAILPSLKFTVTKGWEQMTISSSSPTVRRWLSIPWTLRNRTTRSITYRVT